MNGLSNKKIICEINMLNYLFHLMLWPDKDLKCPCVFPGIIRWCPLIEQIISDGKLLIEQTKVHDSSMGPISVLLEGKILNKQINCALVNK